ncbi:GntR family transcriptional regulator [Sedimentisphaera salicampi]|uniref:Arabinose metabolism transcriptional repressor n=1 Tax=Sedimentisphaera salicampi TaxID=1941349 RepID=A0A1W6LK52_9BACT|nr:GntR family transcriptional regulator [Sedimentisphaera salicampi]ARN56180.1 Arabinose metabolism transcriptional repressor [Sedimentisphaera salicampi]OXU15693.1 Arabinose metabolism transcriptional repressor [Sedimentisphaera salicampi]
MAKSSTEQIELSGKLAGLRGAMRSRPKYEIIKEFLIEELSSGNYQPGQALPSENMLIDRLGVARNTVRNAIDELVKEGYVRRVHGKGNFFTKNPNSSKEEQLAVLSLLLPEISHGIYPVLAKGFDHCAGLKRHQVLLCNTDFNISKQGDIILQMLDKNVSGVAMVPALKPQTPAYHAAQLQRHNIPVVFCHRPVAGVSAPLITWDAAEVAKLAGRTLVENGHKRIAYFARTRYSLTAVHENALRQTLGDCGLELPAKNIFYGNGPGEGPDYQLQKRMDALKPMVGGADPITSIFCNDDEEAELVQFALKELGLRIPEDVSLIGFGDRHARNGVFLDRLTSVTIDEYELGGRAAKVLDEMRTGQRPLDSDEVIYKPLALYQGKTVAQI